MHPADPVCGTLHVRRSRGLLVLSPRGRLTQASATIGEALRDAKPGIVVLDLLHADLTQLDDLVELVSILGDARRSSLNSMVVNAPVDLSVALYALRVPAIDTREHEGTSRVGLT